MPLWTSCWRTGKGKRATPEEAEQFSVLMRLPTVCAEGLQQRSGQDGFYYEPWLDDGRGPSGDFTVIWTKSFDKAEAMHRFKVTDRAVALVRFGHRFGIRTMNHMRM